MDSSGNGRDATIVSPPVNVVTPQGLTGYWEAPWLFKREGTYYLAYARGNPRTGGNPATIDYATATAPLSPRLHRRVLVKLDSTDGVPHIFDFGTGPTRYMYLTPRNNAGVVRFAITANGAANEVRVDGTAALPIGRWTHVAVMKSALVVTLFVNGVPVGQNPNVGQYPARLGNTPNNWFGRAQSTTSPFLAGSIDDIQIHQRMLDDVELAGLILIGLINGLADHIDALAIRAGLKTALTVKLQTVTSQLADGHTADAIAILDNDFVGQVNDLRGDQLSDATADELVGSAALIRSTILRSTG